ncbi:MAG TPA: hypothetical protein VGC02_02935 [Methanobacterium sp.]
MSNSKKDNIIKGKVKHFKGNNRLDNTDTSELFIYVDEKRGFSEKEEVVVLKCLEFPELASIKNSVQLRKKIEEHTDNSKRVRELKHKLESAQESHSESLNVLKIKTDLEIENLKNENKTLKRDNKELTLRLKDVTRRINELNNLLNDL